MDNTKPEPVLTEHLELSTQPAANTPPCNLDDRACTARWVQACGDCD